MNKLYLAATIGLVIFLSGFMAPDTCQAQYDLKAQALTITDHGTWKTLNVYVRNVGAPMYFGADANVAALIYYPAKQDFQVLFNYELGNWIWPHPSPWSWGTDFWDFKKGISFIPKHHNTTARIIFGIPTSANPQMPFYDTNYSNQHLWRDYYFSK